MPNNKYLVIPEYPATAEFYWAGDKYTSDEDAFTNFFGLTSMSATGNVLTNGAGATYETAAGEITNNGMWTVTNRVFEEDPEVPPENPVAPAYNTTTLNLTGKFINNGMIHLECTPDEDVAVESITFSANKFVNNGSFTVFGEVIMDGENTYTGKNIVYGSFSGDGSVVFKGGQIVLDDGTDDHVGLDVTTNIMRTEGAVSTISGKLKGTTFDTTAKAPTLYNIDLEVTNLTGNVNLTGVNNKIVATLAPYSEGTKESMINVKTGSLPGDDAVKLSNSVISGGTIYISGNGALAIDNNVDGKNDFSGSEIFLGATGTKLNIEGTAGKSVVVEGGSILNSKALNGQVTVDYAVLGKAPTTTEPAGKKVFIKNNGWTYDDGTTARVGFFSVSNSTIYASTITNSGTFTVAENSTIVADTVNANQRSDKYTADFTLTDSSLTATTLTVAARRSNFTVKGASSLNIGTLTGTITLEGNSDKTVNLNNTSITGGKLVAQGITGESGQARVNLIGAELKGVTLTAEAGQITGYSLTVDAATSITAPTFKMGGSGYINILTSDVTEVAEYIVKSSTAIDQSKPIVLKVDGNAANLGDVISINNKAYMIQRENTLAPEGGYDAIKLLDLGAYNQTTLVIDKAYAGAAKGTIVAEGLIKGYNAFGDVDEITQLAADVKGLTVFKNTTAISLKENTAATAYGSATTRFYSADNDVTISVAPAATNPTNTAYLAYGMLDLITPVTYTKQTDGSYTITDGKGNDVTDPNYVAPTFTIAKGSTITLTKSNGSGKIKVGQYQKGETSDGTAGVGNLLVAGTLNGSVYAAMYSNITVTGGLFDTDTPSELRFGSFLRPHSSLTVSRELSDDEKANGAAASTSDTPVQIKLAKGVSFADGGTVTLNNTHGEIAVLRFYHDTAVTTVDPTDATITLNNSYVVSDTTITTYPAQAAGKFFVHNYKYWADPNPDAAFLGNINVNVFDGSTLEVKQYEFNMNDKTTVAVTDSTLDVQALTIASKTVDTVTTKGALNVNNSTVTATSIENAGTIGALNGSKINVTGAKDGVSITNRGEITVNASSVETVDEINNYGSLIVIGKSTVSAGDWLTTEGTGTIAVTGTAETRNAEIKGQIYNRGGSASFTNATVTTTSRIFNGTEFKATNALISAEDQINNWAVKETNTTNNTVVKYGFYATGSDLVSADITNSGSFDVASSTITGSINNSGTFDVADSTITGSINNSGTFELANSSVTGGSVSITGTGTFTLSGNNKLEIGTATTAGTPAVTTYDGGLAGSITLADGASIASGSFIYAGEGFTTTGKIVVGTHDTNVEVTPATVPPTYVQAGNTVSIAGLDAASTAIENNGTITVTGALTAGAITKGGAITIDATSSITAASIKEANITIDTAKAPTTATGATLVTSTAIFDNVKFYAKGSEIALKNGDSITLNGEAYTVALTDKNLSVVTAQAADEVFVYEDDAAAKASGKVFGYNAFGSLKGALDEAVERSAVTKVTLMQDTKLSAAALNGMLYSGETGYNFPASLTIGLADDDTEGKTATIKFDKNDSGLKLNPFSNAEGTGTLTIDANTTIATVASTEEGANAESGAVYLNFHGISKGTVFVNGTIQSGNRLKIYGNTLVGNTGALNTAKSEFIWLRAGAQASTSAVTIGEIPETKAAAPKATVDTGLFYLASGTVNTNNAVITAQGFWFGQKIDGTSSITDDAEFVASVTIGSGDDAKTITNAAVLNSVGTEWTFSRDFSAASDVINHNGVFKFTGSTITVSSTAVEPLAPVWDNTVAQGEMKLGSQIAMSLDNSTLTVGKLTNAGYIYATGGSTIETSGKSYNEGGTIILSGEGTSLTAAGQVENAGGTIKVLNGATYNAGLDYGTFLVDGANVNATATFDANWGTFTVKGISVLNLSAFTGVANLEGATVKNSTITRLNGDAAAYVAKLSVAAEQTATFAGANIFKADVVNAGTLTIDGGETDSLTIAKLVNGEITVGGGNFENSGVTYIYAKAAKTPTMSVDATFENTGDIYIIADDSLLPNEGDKMQVISVNGTITNTSTIRVGTLDINNKFVESKTLKVSVKNDTEGEGTKGVYIFNMGSASVETLAVNYQWTGDVQLGDTVYLGPTPYKFGITGFNSASEITSIDDATTTINMMTNENPYGNLLLNNNIKNVNVVQSSGSGVGANAVFNSTTIDKNVPVTLTVNSLKLGDLTVTGSTANFVAGNAYANNAAFTNATATFTGTAVFTGTDAVVEPPADAIPGLSLTGSTVTFEDGVTVLKDTFIGEGSVLNAKAQKTVELGATSGSGKINTSVKTTLSFTGFQGTTDIDVTGLEQGDLWIKTVTGEGGKFTVSGKNVQNDPDNETPYTKYFTYVASGETAGLHQVAKACNAITVTSGVVADVLNAVNHSWTVGTATYYADNVYIKGTKVTGEDKGTVYLQGNSADQLITLQSDANNATEYKAIYGGKMVTGGDTYLLGGDINITIEGGRYTSIVCGGDRVNVITSVRAPYYRDGDITLTINGGTFEYYVAAGMLYQSNYSRSGAEVENTHLVINGGTFKKHVYGGNYALSNEGSKRTTIFGSSTVELNAVNDITFEKTLFVGSIGNGEILGENDDNIGTNLILTGSKTITAGDIWGGSSEDKVFIEDDGTRTFIGGVDENAKRLLTFTGFTGSIECNNIHGFSAAVIEKGTQTTLRDTVTLVDVNEWEIEAGSSLNGAFINDFTGDKLLLTGLETYDFEKYGDWTIFGNTENFKFGDTLNINGANYNYVAGGTIDLEGGHELSFANDKMTILA